MKSKRYSFIILEFVGLLLVSSCTKKEYFVKADGNIFNSCNLDPMENVQIRL